MTADGYYTDATRPLADHEWQERHADLAATLRAVLAMCEHTERNHADGSAWILAYFIRGVIEQASPAVLEWTPPMDQPERQVAGGLQQPWNETSR